MADSAAAPKKHGARWLRIVLSLVILGGLAVAAAKYLQGEEVLAALRGFRWGYAAPILLLSGVYLVLKAGWFGYALSALSHIPLPRLMVAYAAGQPATLIPGGIAARMGLLAEAGVPPAVSSAPVLLNSVLDQVSFILLALAAALWFPQARLPALVMLGILVVISLALAIAPVRRGLNKLLHTLLRRFKWDHHWDKFTESLAKVATPKILISGVVLTVVAKFMLVVVLDWCLRGVGLSASIPALILAVALPTLIGRVTPTPAGAGPTEAAMVAMLSKAAQLEPSATAAAVALFRVTTVLYHALLGALVYFILWRPGHKH
jgi:uncharacterized protein (TIRG00374 family)